MRRHSLRLLVVASVLAGLVAGAVVAVAVPRHAAAPGPPRLDVRASAPAYPPLTGELALAVERGSARVVATAPDPAGGPAWAIRRVVGTYVPPKDVPRDHLGKELLGRHACVELGRLAGGRFGWLDGAGTFRPLVAGRLVGPRLCQQVGGPRHDGDDAGLLTWVSHPDFGDPQALATVVWGAAAATDRDVAVTANGRRADVHRGDAGAFLAFLPADGREPAELRVTATDAGGATHRLYRPFGVPSRVPKLTAAGRLMARAPDPEGGASWGVAAAPSVDGRWCATNPGRVVGGGVGMLDERLDVFYDQSRLTYSCPPPRGQQAKLNVLTRKRPLMYVFTSGAPMSWQRPGGTPGRVALRTDPGATVFAGTARPDVRAITVITPTQTRTIRPSGPGHAFAIAFPGTFPSGRIRFVSTFADGTTAEQDDHADDLS
ncbi:MAG TPA: hypothetical protein VI318_01340 [Baekduia sp.]